MGKVAPARHAGGLTMMALEGVKVVEVAQVWAAPGAGMYLADQGADVVKIEPLWGDDARRVFTQPPLPGGESRSFLPLNRNKRGMAVDISHPAGREIVYRLVDGADVFIHNFRPGVENRLGYDYDTLAGRNPRLVYAAISAFGKEGPYAHRRGYDLLFQSLSGILDKRRDEAGVPISSGVWVADSSAPIALAYGIALALLSRHRTGRGQMVETSLLHMALAMQSVDLVRTEAETARRDETDFSRQALYSPYRCQDGGFVIMVVLSDQQFAGLCRALDVEHLLRNPDYSDNLKRAQKSAELHELISGILSTRPRDHWLRLLDEMDVPAAPVLKRDEVFDHPQIAANGMLAVQEHSRAGRVDMVNIPVRLSDTPGGLRSPAPILGQHTGDVLRELGCDDAEIARLREQGIIA